MENNQEISDVWQAIITWFGKNYPELLEDFNGSCDIELLSRAIEIIGYPDAEVWHLIKIYDGNANYDKAFPIPGLKLLNLEEIIDNWKVWQGIRMEIEETNDSDLYSIKSHPPFHIKEEYITEGIIPFASDWFGGYLAVDFSPNIRGQMGQIINIGKNEDDRYVVAESLCKFLCNILEYLESGKISIIEMNGKSTLTWTSPRKLSFLDVLKYVSID